MSTLTQNSASDGSPYSFDLDWWTARAGGGTVTGGDSTLSWGGAYVYGDSTYGWNIQRLWFRFDTSSIDDGATINSVKFRYRSYSTQDGTQGISVVTAGSTNDASAFAAMGSTALGTSYPTTAAVYEITVTGLTINKTGYTYCGLRDPVYDISGTYPPDNPSDGASLYLTEYSNSAWRPTLIVDWSTASAPTVTDSAPTDITKTTATGNGNVTSDGGATITERGVVWGTSANPTKANNYATASGTTGAFTAGMTGLSPGTLIYWRMYAINSVDTTYSTGGSFTTSSNTPIQLLRSKYFCKGIC
jgi:hypothetical protein